MSDVYSTPEAFGLRQVFLADAAECSEYDMLVIWERLSDNALLMATDSG